MADMECPHLNSNGDKGLYNYPKHPQTTAVLSESAITSLAIDHVSRKLHIDSLGILGHTLTSTHLKLLKPYKRIILWLDPDPAGIKGSIKISKLLPKEKTLKIVLPKTFKHSSAIDKDPDDLEREEIQKRLLKAENFTDKLKQDLKVWLAFDE